MRQKDITEKYLEEYNDVFADIVNVLLFDGERIVHPGDLCPAYGRSQYKAEDSQLHEQERDTAKYWSQGGVKIALCGLENQSCIDQDMPLRIISYDGAAYREQLLHKKCKERYPVVTLVLYFGMNHWRKGHALKEILSISTELEPFVSDYKINIFEIAYLSDEKVAMFQSDFKIVADYFVQLRKNNHYIPSRQTIKHVDAMLKLMAVLTKDERFIVAQDIEEKEGGKTMCEVLDRVEARGIERGIEKGREAGFIEKGISVFINAINHGITKKEAKEIAEIDDELVEIALKRMAEK